MACKSAARNHKRRGEPDDRENFFFAQDSGTGEGGIVRFREESG